MMLAEDRKIVGVRGKVPAAPHVEVWLDGRKIAHQKLRDGETPAELAAIIRRIWGADGPELEFRFNGEVV